MEQTSEWSGDILTQFHNWVEQFYEENMAQLFEPAISEFGKEQEEDLVTKRTGMVLQKTAEQFSQIQIIQFLAAVSEERGYDEVQQFCRQIAECQRLWIILTEFGERRGANPTVGTRRNASSVPECTDPTVARRAPRLVPATMMSVSRHRKTGAPRLHLPEPVDQSSLTRI